MGKKSLEERVAEESAGFCLGFIVIMIIMGLITFMNGNVVVGVVFVFIGIIVIFILDRSGEKSENEFKSSAPFSPNPNYKYKQKKQPKNFTHKSTLEWKKCPKCKHKVNKVAKRCPYCEYEFEIKSKYAL